jgi:hypothetical protein
MCYYKQPQSDTTIISETVSERKISIFYKGHYNDLS